MIPPAVSRGIALAVLLLLAACGSAPPAPSEAVTETSPPVAEEAEAEAVAEEAPPPPAAPPPPPKRVPSRAERELAKLPPVPMLPPEQAMRDGLPAPSPPDPRRLVGLSAEELQKMLGRPDFKRRDPPAQLWQYRKDGCMLDVFLYQGGAGDGKGYKVKHAEARGHTIARISGTDCLLEALVNQPSRL